MKHEISFFAIIVVVLVVLFSAAAVLTGHAQDTTPTAEPIVTNTPAVTPEATLAIIPPAATPAPIVVEVPAVSPEITSLYENVLHYAEILISLLVALFGFSQYLHSSERKQTSAALAASFPAPVQSLLQSGAPLALAAAERTKTPVDDAVLRSIFDTIGYSVTKTDAGYIVALKDAAQV